MHPESDTLIALEEKFWKALVDQDTETALGLLDEPALLVGTHGALQFDHATYRRMVKEGTMEVKSFALSGMEVRFATPDTAILVYRVKQTVAQRGTSQSSEQEMADSSVWVRKGERWLCALHTETPVEKSR